jgi:sporulation protein YlmC with PRC-barrel domain
MIDIPIDADIECADGHCGRSIGVVIDPKTWQVTHFVVEFRHTKRLVSVGLVAQTTGDLIRLRCTRDKLPTLDPVIKTDHLWGERPRYTDLSGPYSVPHTVYEKEAILVPVTYERIPPGKLAVHRNARVKATDGYMGQVDEFLVDPRTGQITHLVLREKRLWGRREVTVPVSEIERMDKETIYLKRDKHATESLLAIL